MLIYFNMFAIYIIEWKSFIVLRKMEIIIDFNGSLGTLCVDDIIYIRFLLHIYWNVYLHWTLCFLKCVIYVLCCWSFMKTSILWRTIFKCHASWAMEFFLSYTIWHFWYFCTKLTTRDFEKFQQKIKLSPVGIELTTPTITGLEFTHPVNLSFLASLRFSNPYKIILYWI